MPALQVYSVAAPLSHIPHPSVPQLCLTIDEELALRSPSTPLLTLQYRASEPLRDTLLVHQHRIVPSETVQIVFEEWPGRDDIEIALRTATDVLITASSP